jgi:hypothetical protein
MHGFLDGKYKKMGFMPRFKKLHEKNRKTGSIRADRRDDIAGFRTHSIVLADFSKLPLASPSCRRRPQVAVLGKYYGDRIPHGIAGPIPTTTRYARPRFIPPRSGPEVSVKTGVLFDLDMQSHDQPLYLPTGSHGDGLMTVTSG